MKPACICVLVIVWMIIGIDICEKIGRNDLVGHDGYDPPFGTYKVPVLPLYECPGIKSNFYDTME